MVEDARSLASIVAEGLRDQGMAVDIAYDGLDAAAKLNLNTYDIVVLDRDLPGIPGDTLCQMIAERDQQVMILMLTAAGTPHDRVSGLKPPSTKGVRVFSADVTADTTYAMQQVVNSGTGSYAKLLNRPVAGKTGTSSNTRSAWLVGFTPQTSDGRWPCTSSVPTAGPTWR